MAYHLMVTMPEYQMSFEFSPMLIRQSLTRKIFAPKPLLSVSKMCVLYRLILLHWRAQLNILRFRVMCWWCVWGKSTYARCGIIVNVTPLEPEWEGHVTLEFSNTTPLPAKIYANEGACQFLFLKGEGDCDVSYADRKGKYQGQRGVTLPRI